MNLPPKDYTPQEHIVAQILDEFGLRYEQQYPVSKYLLDFYIPEIKMCIEADGVYGHFRQRDVKRDIEIMKHPEIKSILRVRETIYIEMKETIWQALNKLVK